MTAYLAIIVLLFLFACAENGRFESKYPGRISCLTLILFGGLRHETGFDWVEYENYYNLILPISASRPEYITYNLLVEPGFQFFCLILRSLGASFQTFLFVVTFVNIVVIYIFARRYTSRVALVFLIYFGFIFLAGQMAAIRQTFSYSFILLAFIQRDREKSLSTALMLIIAVSIHSFSIVFIPIMYWRFRYISTPLLTAVVGIGVAAAFSGFHIVPIIADVFLPVLSGGFVATKLSLYGDYEGTRISLVSLSFIPLHLAAYFLLTTRRFHRAFYPTTITYFAASVTLLILICHSYFGVFPAFWNRVSYLAFFLQAVALSARYREYFQGGSVPAVSIGLAGAAGVAIITYTLNQPTSLPFTPYQNVVIAWATGDPGDGRLRYEYAFREAEIEIAKRRR